MDGWHPVVAAGVGALGFGAIAVAVLLVLLSVDNPTVAPSWALPVFVTAIAAGGAAGLTMKNLNLKRAESRRGTNLMFDRQFETGAQLLGGESESELVAGSLLLSSLLRESPRHAQACADLLCTALRRHRKSDLSPEEIADMMPDLPKAYIHESTAANRARNAVAAAIKRAAAAKNAPSHLRGLRWDFEDAIFGDRPDLAGCVFGPGTVFKSTVFAGMVDLAGSALVGNCEFVDVSAPYGLHMPGITVEHTLHIIDCEVAGRSEVGYGIYLEGATIGGVTVEGVRSRGSLHLDTAKIGGHLTVAASSFSSVCFIDGECDSSVSLVDVTTTDFICLRRVAVRKGVKLSRCHAGAELEVTSVATEGAVNVVDCTYSELIEGEADPQSRWAQKDS